MSQRSVFPDTSRIQNAPDASGDVFRVVMVRQDKTGKQVEVKDCKPLVIKAEHAYDAIEKYKYACGIISTDNNFAAVSLSQEDPRYVDAKELPSRPYDAPVLTGYSHVERNGKEPETNLGVYSV